MFAGLREVRNKCDLKPSRNLFSLQFPRLVGDKFLTDYLNRTNIKETLLYLRKCKALISIQISFSLHVSKIYFSNFLSLRILEFQQAENSKQLFRCHIVKSKGKSGLPKVFFQVVTETKRAVISYFKVSLKSRSQSL